MARVPQVRQRWLQRYNIDGPVSRPSFMNGKMHRFPHEKAVESLPVAPNKDVSNKLVLQAAHQNGCPYKYRREQHQHCQNHHHGARPISPSLGRLHLPLPKEFPGTLLKPRSGAQLSWEHKGYGSGQKA